MGDSLKLQQVLYNVIDNAIKYTPRGGEVHASLSRAGKRAIIRISDTGIGMEEEQIAGLKKDIIEKFAMSKKTFTDMPEEDQEILQLFSFIFTLGYDVYVKKLLLEKLVDNFREVTQKQEPDTGKPTKEKPVKEKAVKDK